MGPGSDAAVLRIKDTGQKIAVTIESNNQYCASDIKLGTQHTIAEAIRNLACVGARGISLTNCLNFGNPQEKEVMGQIVGAIRTIGHCAQHFDTPVTGGNVSLYNQTNSANIHPTPTIGMVGILDHDSKVVGYFTRPGLDVAVVGKLVEDKIYQSEFAKIILEEKDLQCPPISLTQESYLQDFLIEASKNQFIETAHDCSQGGLIQTLIEAAEYSKSSGATIKTPKEREKLIPFLFGEYASRCVIAFDPTQKSKIEELAKNCNLPMTIIGKTQNSALEIEHVCMISKKDIAEKRNSFLRNL